MIRPVKDTSKIVLAERQYDLRFQHLNYAESRENHYSNQFVEIEIQIASIVMGIVGAGAIIKDIKYQFIWIFVAGAISLILSLIFGLIGIHILQKFWRSIMNVDRQVFDIWRNFLLEDGDYKQAKKDCSTIVSTACIKDSPHWPYYFQTIFLILGLVILTVGLVVSLVG